MDGLAAFLTYPLGFAVVLTVVVFVHELGHYWVARRCGVRVEVFSIGFGPELIGRTDKRGTRWKLSAIPFGGYVKMFGDAGAASTPGEGVAAMSEEERRVAFHHKRLGQRAAIVAAGPIANFVYAIIALAFLYVAFGQQVTPAQIGSVVEGSAAEAAGLQAGDRIIAIDGRSIERFEEVQLSVQSSTGDPMQIDVLRDGKPLSLTVTPEMTTVTTRFGDERKVARLGITASGTELVHLDPASAIGQAFRETVMIVDLTLSAFGEMLVGARDSSDLAGVIGIAQMSGEVVQVSLPTTLWFTAMLSINLGLVNLFPIPILDGGHLLFYGFEAVRGRPLSEKAQEYGFRIGLALVLTFMLVATWNDLVRLRVVDFISNLFS